MAYQRPGSNGGTVNIWEPGESGNPKGRPKGSLNASTLVKKFFEQSIKNINPLTSKKEILQLAEWVTIAQIKKALEGDTRAFESLFDRLEGKPTNKVEVKDTTKREPSEATLEILEKAGIELIE